MAEYRLPSLYTAVVHRSSLIVSSLLTDGVSVTCHLTSESTLVSGHKKDLATFLNFLDSKGIEHDTISQETVVPFHNSEFMKELADDLLRAYQNTIYETLARSGKWLSTSTENENATHNAMYHVNSIVQPNLLQNALSKIPRNSYIFEINSFMPQLKGILEESIECVTYASLYVKRGEENKAAPQFLETLGKLFCLGEKVDTNKLYRHEWPVKRGTPMLSHLIGWDHGRDW